MIAVALIIVLLGIGVGFLCAAPQMALATAIDALVNGIESIEEKP